MVGNTNVKVQKSKFKNMQLRFYFKKEEPAI